MNASTVIWVVRQMLGLASRIPASHQHPVLIVEDDVHDADLLGMFCERYGARIVKVHSLKDALEQLHTKKFRLMFVDENMKDGSGVQFIDQITPKYPNLPVSIVTADNDISQKLWSGRNWSIILKGTHSASLSGAVENAILTANGVNGHVQPFAVLISSWVFFTLTFLAGVFCRELPEVVRWLVNSLRGIV